MTITNRPWSSTLVSLTILFAAACGPSGEQGSGVVEAASDPGLGPALASSSCGTNLVAGNGMTGNGLCQNGLAAQGLTLAALSSTNFASWFNVNPGLSDMVMKYVYRCAAPAGAFLSWKNPTTGVTYIWPGWLGLAPGWTGGAAATVAEQQVVTIAVEGWTASGAKIPVGPNELTVYSKPEAAFFGNIFAGQDIFICRDHTDYVNNSAKSSVRGCAFDQQAVGPSTVCPPMYFVGQCVDLCVKNKGGPQYDSCTYNGVTYLPIATRIRPEDIYTCGDGVCQMTEHCGTGATPDSCLADCGPCP
jgi:hypothetical protein